MQMLPDLKEYIWQPVLRTYVVGSMDLPLSFEENYIGYSGSSSAEPGV